MENITQYTEAAFVIIGFVNGLGFVTSREWASLFKFLVAVTAGAVFGYLGWFGLQNVQMGIMAGLGSSGVYKVAQVLRERV